MSTYKGIKFVKGYNRSFTEFKKEFESTHIFKAIPHKERDSELKKAYKIATKKPAKEPNGNIASTTPKVQKDKPKQA